MQKTLNQTKTYGHSGIQTRCDWHNIGERRNCQGLILVDHDDDVTLKNLIRHCISDSSGG